jgi:hypothetical protein
MRSLFLALLLAIVSSVHAGHLACFMMQSKSAAADARRTIFEDNTCLDANDNFVQLQNNITAAQADLSDTDFYEYWCVERYNEAIQELTTAGITAHWDPDRIRYLPHAVLRAIGQQIIFFYEHDHLSEDDRYRRIHAALDLVDLDAQVTGGVQTEQRKLALRREKQKKEKRAARCREGHAKSPDHTKDHEDDDDSPRARGVIAPPDYTV